MIRLTLRQSRSETVIAFVVLAMIAVVLAVTGTHLADVNSAFQTACRAARNCATTPNPVLQVYPELAAVVPLILTFAPAVIGIFLGAPLVARELETGTFRLVWTQSVSLRRWLLVKLTLVGLTALLIASLLTWMIDWWQIPLDAAGQNPFDPVNFGYHGIVPIGYSAFAFALGVAAGALLRRTIPAMAATLGGLIAARLLVEHVVRPSLAAPLHASLAIWSTAPSLNVAAPRGAFSLLPSNVGMPDAWILSASVVDRSGGVLTSTQLLRLCPALRRFPAVSPAAVHACINTVAASFHTGVTFQPASRFWPFQWSELGVFTVAALVLCGLTYFWLRRQSA